MSKPIIFCVIGTRPEAIKVAPVMLEFQKFSDVCNPMLISTGQHKEILYQSLATFGLAPDEDLAIMQHGSSLAQVTCRALEGLNGLVDKHKPAFMLGQGDTTTAMVSAMDAFYQNVPFGHIEAGLRTDTVRNPFPEEYNRRVVSVSADLHFAPTVWSRDNLLRENRDPSTLFVTGNTGIDAVLVAAKIGEQPWYPEHKGRVVLMTTHRRENWGEPQRNIAAAALRLVNRYPDVLLVVAMHPNPMVRDVLMPVLGGHDRIKLIEPPDYALFVKLMQRSSLIISDSGGVQEEAPAFGIPVLVLRDTTERPEGVTAGTAKLVGTDPERIFQEGSMLLGNEAAYKGMANAVSPYGDGKAAERIRYLVLNWLGIDSPRGADVGLINAVILGVVLGLTAYLPISNVAHVRFAMIALHISDKNGAAFSALIQFGPILAVILYFWKDIVVDFGAWFKSLTGKADKNSPEARMGWAVFYGTLPVVVFGVLLKQQIENGFRSLYMIAFALIVMGAIMLAADRFGKNNRNLETVTVKDGWLVGFWQVLALIPGFSRSGSTIAGAQAMGFDRGAAAKFSFLMAIPSFTLAGVFEGWTHRHDISGMIGPVVVANIVSFIVAYGTIVFLMPFLRKYGVGPFVLYRVVLGVVLLGILASGNLKPDAGQEIDTRTPPAAAGTGR